MTPARLILKRRQYRSPDAFVELSVYGVPQPLKGSAHSYKYRLAYIVSHTCVMRYDNESGKGDHKHDGETESPYRFHDLPTLLRDFFTDVERIERNENAAD